MSAFPGLTVTPLEKRTPFRANLCAAGVGGGLVTVIVKFLGLCSEAEIPLVGCQQGNNVGAEGAVPGGGGGSEHPSGGWCWHVGFICLFGVIQNFP